ncbi:hypothetical protein CHLNCDRAFT_134329 [Chlorella variabilis]|uniref:Dehydrogenase/reductase SDR family member 7 n=1 Tax=Chlorella variabilis TaxID=554065 RepID=E1ZFS6_CHLVA|nr:hypothetical protein CHLNCDRAFT_134329 [Chlorella variabilis]EFN55180.1 hypothetical protein CHLNCDRAFT_134329 [Chlorella variabilis]|eukprot:XP_005847282.1 hypothetical protein CHLNCDRAFT_134329 [Chlorella variabilis]
MLLLVAAGAVAAWAAWTLFRFIRADADLTLLSKRAPPPGAWRGKVVWVVGASQGLGEALARHWAAAGAKLILSSRSLEKLQAGRGGEGSGTRRTIAVKELCCQHIREEDVMLLPLDLVGGSEGLEAAASAAFEAFGASQHAAAEDTSPEVAATLLRLNLQGPLALARAVLPHMVAQRRGRHVVVASMSAVVPSPGQSVYAAAKSGLRAYFASMASELSDRGVGATVCCPGPLATGLDGKPRVVYGASGLIMQANTGMSKKRVSAGRAAELIARAAYHGLDECWIAYHPVLLLGYLMQYAPWLGMKVLKRVGPARARALRAGKSGYDMSLLQEGGEEGGASKPA